MADEHQASSTPNEEGDLHRRIHSDVARTVDLDALERRLMQAVGAKVDGIGARVDAMNDELSGFVVRHSQDHVAFATDWEKRWSAITADLAYKRGLIGFPRLVLEWLRQYLPTVITVLGLTAAIIGFLTGSIQVGVGATVPAP